MPQGVEDLQELVARLTTGRGAHKLSQVCSICCSEGLNALHCNLHQLRMLVPEASRIQAFSAGAYHGCLAFTALCRPAARCLKKHCSAGGRQAN